MIIRWWRTLSLHNFSNKIQCYTLWFFKNQKVFVHDVLPKKLFRENKSNYIPCLFMALCHFAKSSCVSFAISLSLFQPGWKSSTAAHLSWNHLWSRAYPHVASGQLNIWFFFSFHLIAFILYKLSLPKVTLKLIAGSWSFQENSICWWNYIWGTVHGEWVNDLIKLLIASWIFHVVLCVIWWNSYTCLFIYFQEWLCFSGLGTFRWVTLISAINLLC